LDNLRPFLSETKISCKKIYNLDLVADQLQAKLSPAEKSAIEQPPTANPQIRHLGQVTACSPARGPTLARRTSHAPKISITAI